MTQQEELPWSDNPKDRPGYKAPKGGDDQLQAGGKLKRVDPDEIASQLDEVANPKRDPESWEFPRTDLGNAELLKLRHGSRLRWCGAQKEWWIWDRRRWAEDKLGQALAMANETARERRTNARNIADEKARKIEYAWALNSESSAKRDCCLSQVKSFGDMCLDLNNLDQNPWALNCRNGILDLKTGILSPHDQAKNHSKVLRVDYIENAACPIWEACINRLMGGRIDLVQFLQRAVGYSLTGSTQESAMFVLWGDGSNGKTVFLNTITAILGEYSTIAASDALIAKNKNNGPNPEIAMLRGARLVSASETASGAKLDESMVKQMTGGDYVTARFLNANHVTFRPVCKIWLATNYRPEIRGGDHGIWRRIRLVPFIVSIPEEEQDRELEVKLKEEWPGILAWAVRGCRDWLANGLQEPESVKQATKEYKSEMDAIQSFMDKNTLPVPYNRVEAARVYRVYKQWCQDTGEFCLSLTKFGSRLAQKGIKKIKTNAGMCYENLMLSTDQTQDVIGSMI